MAPPPPELTFPVVDVRTVAPKMVTAPELARLISLPAVTLPLKSTAPVAIARVPPIYWSTAPKTVVPALMLRSPTSESAPLLSPNPVWLPRITAPLPALIARLNVLPFWL